MKPSLFHSTLSIAFIVCIVSVIAMVFLRIDPNETLLAIIASVISGYLAARNNTKGESNEKQ